jgi:CHASE1-domain containing sensor protein
MTKEQLEERRTRMKARIDEQANQLKQKVDDMIDIELAKVINTI